MQNKNLIIIGIIILILLGGGFYFYQKQKNQILTLPELPTPPAESITPELTPSTPTLPTSTEEILTSTQTVSQSVSEEVVVRITADGFEPREITVDKGTKVTWINEQNSPSWPASAVHPTHRVYPGSDIVKCGTPEQDKIFDSCRGLKKGESWNFVFNEVGEWYYHDHLNPSWTGKIVVK